MLEQYVVPTLVTLTLLLLTFTLYFKYYQLTYWKRRGVFQLDTVFPFGNALDLFIGRSNFGGLFKNWYLEFQKRGLKHGGAYFFGTPVYIPVDLDIVKKIMISDFIHFPNHGFFIDDRKNPADPLSAHIFNMENYKWKALRSKIPAAFTTSKMKNNVAVISKISQDLVEVLSEYEKNRIPVDAKDVLTSFTLDINAQCSLGLNTEILKGKNMDLKRLSRVFFDSQFSILRNTIVLLIPRPVLAFFNFKLFPKRTTDFFMRIFRDIRELRSKENFTRNDLTDILLRLGRKEDQLLKTDYTGKKQMNPLTFDEVAAQMYIFLEAGFETTSSTQTFALYELAINPQIQDKLREEINSVLERFDGKICYESVAEMEYLGRVVDETLRLYPAFPILPRVCQKDYNIPGTDVTLEKGTFVMTTNFGVQRNPEYWPNPDKFDPERFTNENKANRHSMAFLPFGEGPRVCPGKRFGLWQTRMGVASVIKNFRVSLNEKSKLPFRFAHDGLILKMDGDLWLNLEKVY